MLPIILLLLAIKPEYQPAAYSKTLTDMEVLKKWVKTYQKKFNHISPSLREVAAYAESKQDQINIYDRYGLKFDIRYLDSSTLLIKSWGNINFPNKNHSYAQNLFLAPPTWKKRFPVVIHSYPTPPTLYQPAQLLSSTSYNKNYSARIFLHDKTHMRTLVVVHNNETRDPILIHSSNNPEEFIWFPGSSLLAFTSDPETSSKGPLHIFDVERDEIRSVRFGKETTIDHKKRAASHYFIAALAGAHEDKLYVYLTPYNSTPVNPDTLFRSSNLYEVQVTFPGGKFRAKSRSLAQEKPPHTLHREYSAPKLGEGDELQKQWFNLKITGAVENNIEQWQAFAIKAYKDHSPILPYALMTLISLFERASTLYRTHNSNLAQQMHSQALSYAQLIADSPGYPAWLRSISTDAYHRLKVKERTTLSKITPLPR